MFKIFLIASAILVGVYLVGLLICVCFATYFLLQEERSPQRNQAFAGLIVAAFVWPLLLVAFLYFCITGKIKEIWEKANG